MKTFKRIFFLLSLAMIFACQNEQEKVTKPKNVILLISDGTGLSQISSAYFFKDAEPNYSRFENIGFIKTSSSKEDVTDSAAGATAFASGVKTYNGAIGVTPDSLSVPTLIELVQSQKIRTGVIATSSITHATPASFYAHEISRRMYEEIAKDLFDSDIDFFAGGGLKFFTKRKDSLNLSQEFEDKGFYINTKNLTGLKSIRDYTKAGFLLADDAMPKMQDGRGDFLPNATQLGMDFLNNDKGFFMMVEGSQIDWGGHVNDADYTVAELIDFDNAIGRALDFAEKDGNTLVIVTSDHETGGFTLRSKRKKRENGKEYSDYSEVDISFSTTGHSATLIPVFAYGPGAEKFKGIYENNEIFHKILDVTKWASKK
tara:strand:- start:3669 stop:4784 length:1116 start_codon:yes stop_codon:yes gene_type:complete